MNLEKNVDYESVKEKLESYGYYATDELTYFLINGILKFQGNKRGLGQDIYAVCLEGPPGAGKTRYAEVYTELLGDLYNDNVEMLSYQCDPTTGKSELFEEINITAVVSGNVDKINIPGKIIKALNEVNSGKKVILFIDEYDKSREETDAFLLQFLQSGKINSVQHGDLTIKEEYKNNLQVIICKNDKRNISGPLSRRLRTTRLDYMKPEILYQVLQDVFYDENGTCLASEGILNLVLLIYNNVYPDKKLYKRLPSCSEVLTAIGDASDLIINAKAPNNVIYKIIIETLFKDLDSITTFESRLDNAKDLKKIIDEMIKCNTTDSEKDILDLIKTNIFKETTLALFNEYQKLLTIKASLGNGEVDTELLNRLSLNMDSQSNNASNSSKVDIGNKELKDPKIDEHAKYEIVKKSIDNILNEVDVEESDEIISAYDLKQQLTLALTELRELSKYIENFRNQVNQDNTMFKKVGRFLNKKNTLEHLLKLDHIIYETEKENTANMVFMFSNINHHMRIARKFNAGNDSECGIYFDYSYNIPQEQLEKDNEFIKKYCIQIEYILNTMEKWHKFLGMCIGKGKETDQYFTFDEFRLSISYSDEGSVGVSIESIPQIKDLFSKNWVGEPSINKIISENGSSLLKKIPLRKGDLNKVLTDLLNLQEHDKVKQLKK